MSNMFRSAKTLGQLSGWSLSNLEMQKLLYLAHMVHVGEKREGQIVTSELEFEAWDWGPVSPRLYHKVKAYGDKPVPDIFAEKPFKKDSDEYKSISEVYTMLKDAAPGRLVRITHWEDGAWAKHYVTGSRGIKIPDADITNEYRKRVKREREAAGK